MALSWDPKAVEAAGRATAEEVSSTGVHWTFSPVRCIARDTRWGRVDETFGEDPMLIGEMASALFQFYHGVTALGDVCSGIDSITEGYLNPLPNGAGPSDLVPVWSISTDTGAYLLNTLTGELSRADPGEPELPF